MFHVYRAVRSPLVAHLPDPLSTSFFKGETITYIY